jgi:hypothetical protein
MWCSRMHIRKQIRSGAQVERLSIHADSAVQPPRTDSPSRQALFTIWRGRTIRSLPGHFARSGKEKSVTLVNSDPCVHPGGIRYQHDEGRRRSGIGHELRGQRVIAVGEARTQGAAGGDTRRCHEQADLTCPHPISVSSSRRSHSTHSVVTGDTYVSIRRTRLPIHDTGESAC